MSDLVIVTVKLEPSIKDWLAEFALEHRTTMSEVLRCALAEYLATHCTTEEEREVAEVIRRRRFENMKLEIPKDEFNSLLFPNRVRTYVNQIKFSWEKGRFLTSARYDNLVDFVEKQKRVVEGNPNEELIVSMLDQIISDLRREQQEMKV